MASVKLAVYVTAHTVRKIARGELDLAAARRLLDKLGIEKVYIENYRFGLLVGRDELEAAVSAFRGYEVAGGSCIGTWGEGWGRYADFGFKVVCLTDERNLKLIEEAMEGAGEVFDGY